jgi:hypothetical protein
MNQNVHAEVAALRGMTPAQLRDKYLEVFGEPTRSGNKDFLCKRLAWRLQSMAEGSRSDPELYRRVVELDLCRLGGIPDAELWRARSKQWRDLGRPDARLGELRHQQPQWPRHDDQPDGW